MDCLTANNILSSNCALVIPLIKNDITINTVGVSVGVAVVAAYVGRAVGFIVCGALDRWIVGLDVG